jgi:hypothetical protein
MVSLCRFVLTCRTCTLCIRNIDRGLGVGVGVKNRCISHTKIWSRGQYIYVYMIQTARAKYCLLSFIRVSKQVAKQPSYKHGKMLVKPQSHLIAEPSRCPKNSANGQFVGTFPRIIVEKPGLRRAPGAPW